MTDRLSTAARSALMSRVRGKNTGPEKLVCSALRARGVYFSTHASRLPGRPDIVFWRARVVVFIDGDFWHGWRFPAWEQKLPEFWKAKIGRNRSRDQLN